MPLTLHDLENFHEFARRKLGQAQEPATLVQLAEDWESAQEQDEVQSGIRRGLADVEAGRYRPLAEFIDEFRAQHKIAPDA